MTRKDYVLIARVLRDAKQHCFSTDTMEGTVARNMVDHIAAKLAEVLKQDNPRFAQSTFFAFINDEEEAYRVTTQGQPTLTTKEN